MFGLMLVHIEKEHSYYVSALLCGCASRHDRLNLHVWGGYTRDPSPIDLVFPRPLLLKVQFIEQQNGSLWELVRNALRPQPY